MGSELDPQKKSGRKGRHKVRTGCYTCKIRKVKCDEAKPHCRRCLDTGRKCDGYPSTFVANDGRKARKKLHATALMAPTTIKWKSNYEQHAFKHWCELAAPALGGQLGHPFFAYIIPQYCYREVAVRAAILAVSASHEQFVMAKSRVDHARQQQLARFMLEQYNDSINLLGHHMSHGRHELVILVCSCYVIVELLQGELRGVSLHTEQGRSLLASDAGIEAVRHSKALSTYVLPMFWRLSYVEFLFGKPPRIPSCHLNDAFPYTSGPEPQVIIAENLAKTVAYYGNVNHFENLGQARAALVQVINRSLELLWLKDNFTKLGTAAPELHQLHSYQRASQHCLETWFLPFTQLQMRLASTRGNGPLTLAASNLHMQYLVVSIWLAEALSDSEMAYDAHQSTFLSITALGAPLVASQPVTMGGPTDHPFTNELNLISLLYFTAAKCRWPHIRNTAISLMKSAPQYHQTLRGRLMARVADLIADWEQSHVTQIPGGPTQLPGDYQRIFRTDIKHLPDVIDGKSKHVVTFYRRSEDLSQEMEVMHETVYVNKLPESGP